MLDQRLSDRLPTTKTHARYEALMRVLVLADLLRGREYCQPIPELADALGVSTRTVRRYLDAMSLVGMPVPMTHGEYVRDILQEQSDRTGVGARRVGRLLKLARAPRNIPKPVMTIDRDDDRDGA